MAWTDQLLDDLRSDGPFKPDTEERIRDAFEAWIHSPGTPLHEHLGVDRRQIILRERNPHLLAALSELPGKPEARCKDLAKIIAEFVDQGLAYTDEPDPEWPDVFWHLWRAFLYDHLEKVPRTAKRLLGIWKSEAVCISTDEGQNLKHDNSRKTKVAR